MLEEAIASKGQIVVTSQGQTSIECQRIVVPCFREQLGDGVELDMVLIPGGEFWMGSPEDELEHRDRESPRHLVKVPQFFMGKYPVTQSQWRAVAAFPKVERELRSDPSHFKGNNRPVEKVKWFDAVEFCQRLSKQTGRQYRLPSEAEWEYACRAGTTTPFHFGETITTDLANYRGTDNEELEGLLSASYGRGPKGEFREKTTEVGSFPANAFGIYDMHGNVWEWCADDWHDNYEGAPADGRIWLNNNPIKHKKLIRGGSWTNNPGNCRSAFRLESYTTGSGNNTGFRVVCVAPGML
ncbi:serine/threonine protein kinase [Geitlerinema sp. FC II]|nr:serine/threonine protein kinase [Geitlerinema sp. FC II]